MSLFFKFYWWNGNEWLEEGKVEFLCASVFGTCQFKVLLGGWELVSGGNIKQAFWFMNFPLIPILIARMVLWVVKGSNLSLFLATRLPTFGHNCKDADDGHSVNELHLLISVSKSSQVRRNEGLSPPPPNRPGSWLTKLGNCPWFTPRIESWVERERYSTWWRGPLLPSSSPSVRKRLI